jgi:hypothetical protein
MQAYRLKKQYAMLLIKSLQFLYKTAWSLYNPGAFPCRDLFTNRKFWNWINDPYESPILKPTPYYIHLIC